jgi:hypothetical protein
VLAATWQYWVVTQSIACCIGGGIGLCFGLIRQGRGRKILHNKSVGYLFPRLVHRQYNKSLQKHYPHLVVPYKSIRTLKREGALHEGDGDPPAAGC